MTHDPSPTSAATADPPIIFDLPVAPDPNYCIDMGAL